MKKTFLFLAAAALLFGCTKEQGTNTNDNIIPDTPEEVASNTEGTLVSFNAIIPEFAIPTKASVDLNGDKSKTVFSWEVGDEIAIPKAGGGYLTFTNSAEHPAVFSRALGVGEEIAAGTAYYPASAAPEGGYSTTFSSVANAKKGFKMTADVARGAASLSFTHQSAIVQITFTNVPSIANKLVVKKETSDVAVIDFTSPTSTMTFDIPLDPDAGTKTYKFMLQENSNILKRASQETTIVAGTYYYSNATVPVGHIIRVQDAVDWGSRELYVWNLANTKENATFLTSNEYPYKFNTTGDHDHYIVLPSQLGWATPTNKIGVKFQAAGGTPSTETPGIYPLRDITFNVPAELGMKTQYRIYPHSSTLTSLNLFVTKPTTLTTTSSDSAWSDYEVYWWSNKTGSNVEPWGNWDTRNGTRLSLGVQEIPTELVGYATNSGLIVGDLDSDQSKYKPQLNTCFYGDITADLTNSGVTITEDLTTKRLSSAWPGSTVSSVTNSVNTSAYYVFDTSNYGDRVWVILSNGGASQTAVWEITVNQDFDYGY